MALPGMYGPLAAQLPVEQSVYRLRVDSLDRLHQRVEALAWLTSEQETLEHTGRQESADYMALLWVAGGLNQKVYNFELAEHQLTCALELQRRIAPADRETEILLQDALANFYETADPPKAIPLYEKSLMLRLAVSGDDTRSAAKGYYELAIIHTLVGDYEAADDYGLKAIRSLKNAGLTEDPDYGGYHQMLGWIHQEEGDLPKALQYYSTALPMIRARLGEHIETAKCMSTIGEVYAQLGDTDKGLEYQLAAAGMFEKVDTPQCRYLRACYFYLGVTYNLAKQPEQALEYLQRSQYACPENGEPRPSSTPVLLHRSKALSQLGDFQGAIACADSALTRLRAMKNSDHNYLCRALLTKANILSQAVQQGNSPIPNAAVESVWLLKEAIDTMVGIVSAFQTERNKLAAYREAYATYDLAITLSTQLAESAFDPDWLKVAFRFSEESKGLLLYQQLMANKYRRWSAVPLAAEENRIREQIVAAKKVLYELETTGRATPRKDSLQEQLFVLNGQYTQIKKDIEAAYPGYFANPDTLRLVRLSALQARLSPGEGLLEFFTGATSISAFLVLPDTLIYRRIEAKKSVERDVALFRESIGRYFLAPQKNSVLYLSAATDYVDAAWRLYQSLLAPFSGLLPARLTIVPDGVLAYLPFEALLVERPDRPDRFHLHHYLARDYTLRYAYSATLLREMESLPPAPSSTAGLLALAPFFDGSTEWRDSLLVLQARQNRADLAPLPYSGEEVYKVAEITDGKALTGANATKNAFIAQAPQSRALHLATHARANDIAGDYSYLVFAPDPLHPDGDRLYVSEIYGLQLNAELVTLSACETGLGQMYRGEGIVSVARAFASAGARSIVQSQWAVSDAQTRRLMELFYQNLKTGLPKDRALQKARSAYLAAYRGELAHPYFWAGFILIGDNAPLHLFNTRN